MGESTGEDVEEGKERRATWDDGKIISKSFRLDRVLACSGDSLTRQVLGTQANHQSTT